LREKEEAAKRGIQNIFQDWLVGFTYAKTASILGTEHRARTLILRPVLILKKKLEHWRRGCKRGGREKRFRFRATGQTNVAGKLNVDSIVLRGKVEHCRIPYANG